MHTFPPTALGGPLWHATSAASRACLAACAQVVLLLDADFIVSHDLHEALTQPDKAAALMEDLTANRRAVVLPAFETEASLGVEAGGDMALQAQASALPPILGENCIRDCPQSVHDWRRYSQKAACMVVPVVMAGGQVGEQRRCGHEPAADAESDLHQR